MKLSARTPRYINIWHWSNGAIIIALLLTVLMVKVLLDPQEQGQKMQQKLAKSGIELSKEDTRALTKVYSHEIWDWHTVLGYGLGILFLYRLYIERKQPTENRFINQIKAATIRFKTEPSADLKHYRRVKILYGVFYLVLIIMILTGLFIAWSDDVESLKPLRKPIKKIHEIGMYLVLAFAVFHVLGVILQWVKEGKTEKAKIDQ